MATFKKLPRRSASLISGTPVMLRMINNLTVYGTHQPVTDCLSIKGLVETIVEHANVYERVCDIDTDVNFNGWDYRPVKMDYNRIPLCIVEELMANCENMIKHHKW